MNYDAEITSDINEGCDKMDDLLDAVRELRGDSEDVVLGLFNSGVDTGSVGGCGGDFGAVTRNGRGTSASHELAHALGRQHAPCDNVTRCANPLNTDDNYPDYSNFDSDSIGEVGFDPFNLSIKDPGDAHDIMGYSPNKWISPYTYKALMSRIPEAFGGAAGAAAARRTQELPGRDEPERGDWIKRKQSTLFLRLAITRERKVTLKPAFHFSAYPQAHGTRTSGFVAELHDADGRVLKRSCIYQAGHGCSCHAEECRWPLRLRHAMSFDPRAARLVIYEGDQQIHHQSIGAAPKVRMEVDGADDRQQGAITVRWHADCEQGQGGPLWYLVQWRDTHGVWRGVAPRLRQRDEGNLLTVPKSVFGSTRLLAVRVLASAGIATGAAQWEGVLARPGADATGGARLRLRGVPAESTGAVALGPLLRAVLDGDSSTAAGAAIRWYNSRGAEIGRGATLDLRQLHGGKQQVHAVALDTGRGRASSIWTVERLPSGQCVVHLTSAKKLSTTSQGADHANP